MGWQCAVVAISFFAGTIIQGLLVLNSSNYSAERWQGTLLTIAITALAIIFNTFLVKKLPMVESFTLIIHVVGLFAIITPLWILAPHASAKSVFTEFSNGGDWSSMGVSFMVGLSSQYGTTLGFDCIVHMCK